MDTETTMASEAQNNTVKNQANIQTGLGKRLRTAREMLRISEKEAAARLYLNPKMIFIMEDEDFENGPPATFMRGYLRSYARLLNMGEHEISAAIAQLEDSIPQSPSPTAPPILNTRPRDSHRYLRWMTYVVILVMIALVSIWWITHSNDVASTFRSAVASVTPSAANSNTETVKSPLTMPATTNSPEEQAVVMPVIPGTDDKQQISNIATEQPKADSGKTDEGKNKIPAQSKIDEFTDDSGNNNDNVYSDY